VQGAVSSDDRAAKRSGPRDDSLEPGVFFEEAPQPAKAVLSLLSHRRDVAADGPLVAGTLETAPGAGDLLLELHHP
jgi:hypothetical protein